MSLTKRSMKALRNATRRAYPDWDAVIDLDEQGYLHIKTLSPGEMDIVITDLGKKMLRDWESRNEVRI